MYYTHINRNVIQSNRKHGNNEPVVRIQEGRYGTPEYCFDVRFPVGARLRYKPDGDAILPCGARLVIESETKPEVIE